MQPLQNRNLFHINPSSSQYATLLPIAREEFKFTLSNNYPKPVIKESDQIRNQYKQQQVFRTEVKESWGGNKYKGENKKKLKTFLKFYFAGAGEKHGKHKM